jgi:hypothetical protein
VAKSRTRKTRATTPISASAPRCPSTCRRALPVRYRAE